MSKEDALFSGWKGFSTTDPKNHDENAGYIYFVHCLMDERGRIEQNIARLRHIKDTGDESANYHIIDLEKEPNRIHEKPIVSTSLIGRGKMDGYEFDQTKTWTNVGLILKVPIKNILRSGPEDLGSNFFDPSKEIEKDKDVFKGDSKKLLFKGNTTYNEVLVQGETEYGRIEVVGVLLNGANGHILTGNDWVKAKDLERKTGKPLIELREKEITINDVPIHVENLKSGSLSKVTFSRDNKEYYCDLYRNEWGLYIVNDNGISYGKFMNEEQAQIFIKELENLSTEDKEKYAEIIELIPSQYELWKEMRSEQDRDKRLELKRKIKDKNHIIEEANKKEKVIEEITKKSEERKKRKIEIENIRTDNSEHRNR